MSNALETQFLDRLFTDLRNDTLVLPTLPEVALQVRDILAREDSSLADVAKVIIKDAALAARLIQVVNSPLLRTGNPIESIESAVTRLGSNMIRNLVTSMAMEQMFQATSEVTDKRLRNIWKHSTEVASIALALAKSFPNLKPDQAMLAGLTHDIGALPILSKAEEYPELLKDEDLLDQIVSQAHTAVGTAILDKWNFPDELIKVAMEHENLQYESTLPDNLPDYVDLVIVANLQSSGSSMTAITEIDLSAIPSFEKLGLSNEIEIIEVAANHPDLDATQNMFIS